MIVLCRMATAVADWAHARAARAAREYARTLLTGPHCCATTSFDHASPTSHRAQRECPATQIVRHGCRQHTWAVRLRAHRDTVILTQHNTSFQGHQFLAPREECPVWATRNATWHESCARAVHLLRSTWVAQPMASMVMARPPSISVYYSNIIRLGSVLTVAMMGRRYLIGSNEALLPRLASSGLEKGHRQPMPMSS